MKKKRRFKAEDAGFTPKTQVEFVCCGCGAKCVATLEPESLLHPMPPCEEFMIDQPLDAYMRKCSGKAFS